MPFTIKCFNGTQPPGTFYIQNKGLHAGRPLKNPIANCFVIYTEDEHLFSRVYALFVGRCFEYYIIGSVIPTIRIGDVKNLIEQAQRIPQDFTKQLQAIHKIDSLLCNIEEQRTHYRALQRSICRTIYKEIELK